MANAITQTDAQREEEAQKATQPTAISSEEAKNYPKFGLPMLAELAPDRGEFEPKIADALELRQDAIKLLKALDGHSLKGDTTIYADIMQHMAELCWRSTKDMGHKSGTQGGVEVKGIPLSFETAEGLKPNDEAWKDLRNVFLEEVEAASKESNIPFETILTSPTLTSILPKCYRAGILMCFGLADIRIFKKSPRPVIETQAEPEGTKFNPKIHVYAPAAPINQLQPLEISISSKKGVKPTCKPNTDTFFTYMSADMAVLLHDRMFSKSSYSSTVVVDEEKNGRLMKRKNSTGSQAGNGSAATSQLTRRNKELEKEVEEYKAGVEPTVVQLSETSKPEDVWIAMRAMTSDMATGEVTIPVDTQKQAVRIVQEMVDNLDKNDIKPIEDALINLQAAIEAKCEATGTAINIFKQVEERLVDIPNIFKMADAERVPIIAIYTRLKKDFEKALT